METRELLEDIEYSKDLSVIQANELVRSKQDDLTLLEAKLVRLAVGQVLKQDTDFRTYSCNITELARFLGISNKNLYRDIQTLGTSLMRKSIFIKDNSKNNRKGRENYKIFHWVDYIEYNNGTITFRLSESLKPYLIGLDKLFTMYGYSAIMELPTNYSIRLYELIVSYQNMAVRPSQNNEIQISKTEFRFPVEDLRKYFNCEDKYPNTGDFIKRVIDSSIKAIQLNTPARVSYRTERNGRKITHIIFKIHFFYDLEYDKAILKLQESETP